MNKGPVFVESGGDSRGQQGSNHTMALTERFMSFNRVGQLYYRLANLLKVCALNLMLNTSNLRYREIIYSVQGGLRVRTWHASHRLECTNKFTRNK